MAGSSLLVAALVAVCGTLVLALRALENGDVARPRAALGVAASFAGAAAGVLIRALLQRDLSYSLVANHTTLNLEVGQRLMALFDGGPSTALVMAVIIGVTGAAVAGSASALATIAMVVTALLSAALAGHVLSVLPWSPAEGLGLTPSLQHPLGYLSVGGALVAAVAVTIAASRAWQVAIVRGDVRRWICSAFATLVLSAVAMGDAAVLSGVNQSSVATGASGVWLAAAVATAWSALRPLDSGGTLARLAGCVGLAAILAASLAGMGGEAPGAVPQAMVLAVLMAGVASAIAWRRSSAGSGGRRRIDLPALLVLLSLAVLATTVMLGRSRSESDATVAVGQVVHVGQAEVAHQGLSRYETEGSHVLAVALEEGARVHSAEKREYFDSQGVTVGTVVSRPAVLRGAWTWTYVWLDGVEAGDVVRLRSQTVSFAWGWWLSVLLAFGAAIAGWVRSPPVASGAVALVCAGCAGPVRPGALWCSNCGRSLAAPLEQRRGES